MSGVAPLPGLVVKAIGQRPAAPFAAPDRPTFETALHTAAALAQPLDSGLFAFDELGVFGRNQALAVPNLATVQPLDHARDPSIAVSRPEAPDFHERPSTDATELLAPNLQQTAFKAPLCFESEAKPPAAGDRFSGAAPLVPLLQVDPANRVAPAIATEIGDGSPLPPAQIGMPLPAAQPQPAEKPVSSPTETTPDAPAKALPPLVRPSAIPVQTWLALKIEGSVASIAARELGIGAQDGARLRQVLEETLRQYGLGLDSLSLNGTQMPIGISMDRRG